MQRAGFVGATLGVITFAGYMVGAGRAFGYDAAVTMQEFVTGDLGDVLGRQVGFNNHPLFSLVEHLIWRITGSSGEVTMRVAPALFAAAAVGLLTWRVAARWGVQPGLVGGLVLAAHPLVADQRDVRGYTLAVLAIVVMGIAAIDRPNPGLFAAAIAVGVGTHLYSAVPAFALIVILWRSRRLTMRWVLGAALGLLAGLSAYAGMIDQMGRGAGERRTFRPSFPLDAGWELLGGNLVAVGSLGLLIALSVMRRPPAAVLTGSAALTLVGVIIPWLLAPTDLYPRFVYFAVPAVALASSAAVRHYPPAILLGAVAAVAMLAPSLARWSEDELPNRQLARVARGQVCGFGYRVEALRWYEPSIVVGTHCPTVALLSPDRFPADAADLAQIWPVTCWSVDGAELRGRTPADCP